MYIEHAAATAKLLQSCPTLCDPRDGSPPGSPILGILQARNGVGCHFLFQCMKVKSESEVAQLCPTLSDPMDCSLPGSSIHGIFQARELEWGAIAFSNSGMTSGQLPDLFLASVTLSVKFNEWTLIFQTLCWRRASALKSRTLRICLCSGPGK